MDQACVSWVYLPGREADCLPLACSGGGLSAPSRSNRIASASSPSARLTAAWIRSLSGMTSVRLTVGRGAGTPTSSAAGSLARTSAPPGAAQAWQETARAFGLKCSESLARCGLRMSLPKTPRCFALAASEPSSRDWPGWGIAAHGVCSELGTSVRLTDATACGSLLPTPTGAGNEGSASMQKWPAHRALQAMLPTCRASDAEKGGRGELLAVVRGKAPRKRDAHLYLPTPIAMMATPTATLYGSNQGGAAGRTGKKRLSLEGRTGGVFIALREWMMGWPLGWSACEPLETDRFRQWLRSHGAPLRPWRWPPRRRP